MSVMSTPSRLPWIAAVFAFVLIWSMWTLNIPQSVTKSAGKATQQVNSHPEDEAVRLALENENLEDSLPVLAITSDRDPSISERPLVLFAYSESENARTNLQFFISHGLHAQADFIFILNGETDASSLIPTNKPNIRFIQRRNDCYDLGAYAEVLTTYDLYKEYKRFIMLNASIRGPFVPYYSEGCWTDMYLSKITEEVKLVGMTANCWPALHVQSMIWATDNIGLSILLSPSPSIVQSLNLNPTYPLTTTTNSNIPLPPFYSGINTCFHTWSSAVTAEIGSSALIIASGYKIDVMMSAFHSAENYEDVCEKGIDAADPLMENHYFGMNVHPFETAFIKTNRGVDVLTIERLTEWTGKRAYSSYDYCKA